VKQKATNGQASKLTHASKANIRKAFGVNPAVDFALGTSSLTAQQRHPGAVKLESLGAQSFTQLNSAVLSLCLDNETVTKMDH